MDVISAVVVGEPWGDLHTDSGNFGFFEVGDSLIPFMHCIAMWSTLLGEVGATSLRIFALVQIQITNAQTIQCSQLRLRL